MKLSKDIELIRGRRLLWLRLLGAVTVDTRQPRRLKNRERVSTFSGAVDIPGHSAWPGGACWRRVAYAFDDVAT